MAITAALVKELRERTGAGMMECKKALNESNGDIEAAIEAMRISGQAKAAKKAGRVAADGIIKVTQNDAAAVILEVNCETDFVAKGDEFQNFCTKIAQAALDSGVADAEALLATEIEGETVETHLKNLIAKIGENMNVRRVARIEKQGSQLGLYMHGVRIGVLIDVNGGDEELAKDLAMHIAASRPVCVSANDLPGELIEKEREIYMAQAQESGKPAEIVEKMVNGRLQKYMKEVTLLGQPFVKDSDQTVEKLLKSSKAEVIRFVRFEVGEGIEKKEENFAEEVEKAAKGA